MALTEFFKAAPQALAVPGVAASCLRVIGEGYPKVEHMADLLAPDQSGEATPETDAGATHAGHAAEPGAHR